MGPSGVGGGGTLTKIWKEFSQCQLVENQCQWWEFVVQVQQRPKRGVTMATEEARRQRQKSGPIPNQIKGVGLLEPFFCDIRQEHCHLLAHTHMETINVFHLDLHVS